MVQSILNSYEQVIVRVAIEDLNFLMNLDLIEFGWNSTGVWRRRNNEQKYEYVRD